MEDSKIYLIDVDDLGVEEGYPKLEGKHTAYFRVSIDNKGKLYGGFKVDQSYFKGKVLKDKIIKEVNMSWKSY